MESTSKTELHYAVFMVDDVPYCLWSEKNPRNLTIEFLDNIQPKFFEYQADTNLNKLNYKKRRQMAAIALRTAYSHGLETLFFLLCASIQAPHCVPGWMLFCQNKQLYSLLGKINDSKSIDCMLQDPISWDNISSAVFASLVLPDKKKEKNIKAGFAELWSRWSSDFVKTDFTREYNSIKHGFRVKPGQNYVALRSPQSSKGTLLGKGEFGSSYYGYESFGKTNNYQLTKNTRSWEPEAMAWGLHLISMSIINIVSAIKAVNGIPATEVKFSYPSDIDTFSKPWLKTSSFGVNSFSFKINIPVESISQFSSDELKKLYKEGKVLDGKGLF
jgi:hypothetical protein